MGSCEDKMDWLGEGLGCLETIQEMLPAEILGKGSHTADTVLTGSGHVNYVTVAGRWCQVLHTAQLYSHLEYALSLTLLPASVTSPKRVEKIWGEREGQGNALRFPCRRQSRSHRGAAGRTASSRSMTNRHIGPR